MTMTKTRKIANGKKSTDWVFFEKRFDVPDYDDPKGKPSRSRWRLIHTPWFGIYIHKWNKPDPRPTRHNHPWNFFSIVLKGWYVEHILDPEYNILVSSVINWFNWVPRTKFHNVAMVSEGAISIMFVGKTHPDWGYMEEVVDYDHGSYYEYIPFDKHTHSEEFTKALKERNS